MSYKIIKGFINLKKINQSRVYTLPDKDGEYLKIIMIQGREKDKYGNICYNIKEDVSREEREQGTEGNFLGQVSEKEYQSGGQTGAGPSSSKPATSGGGYQRPTGQGWKK